MELSAIQSSGNPELVEHENCVQEDLLSLLDQEDHIWRQQAKANWLKDGDCITKYFLACASQRSRRNTVTEIADQNGRLCTN